MLEELSATASLVSLVFKSVKRLKKELLCSSPLLLSVAVVIVSSFL